MAIEEPAVEKFYNEIIVQFDTHEEIFGKIDDFKSFIQSPEKKEDEYIIYTKLQNLNIHFQIDLFDLLFCSYPAKANIKKANSQMLSLARLASAKDANAIGSKLKEKLAVVPKVEVKAEANATALAEAKEETDLHFDSKLGQLMIENKLYSELFFSEGINFSIEKIRGQVSGSESFIFIKGSDEIYPKEVIPYFLNTLKHRFINKSIRDVVDVDFYGFFKPIESLIVINKQSSIITANEKNLLKNLKFQMAKQYGLIPIEEERLVKKFDLHVDDADINNIKTNVNSKTTSAIDYYLKGLRTTDIFYQFVNFYQIVEHYSIDCSLKYLTKKIEKEEPYELYKNIKKQIGKEGYLISCTISYLLDGQETELKTKIDKLNSDGSFQTFIKMLKDSSGDIKDFKNWEDNYIENLGILIYKIRNEIIHAKREQDILGDLVSRFPDIFQYIVEVLKKVSEKAIEKNLSI